MLGFITFMLKTHGPAWSVQRVIIDSVTKVEHQRAEERDRLLECLRASLEADRAVGAAYLFGSFGRGDADAWSDLDVVIVAPDEQFEDLLRCRYDQVARLGDVVLTFESSYNGPPGGCYLMTGYDSPTGIMLVDWYWQPLRAARTPSAHSMLVERVAVPMYENAGESLVTLWQRPENEKSLALWDPTGEQDRANCAALAWAMLAIQTKHVARSPDEPGLGFQDFIVNLISTAAPDVDLPRWDDPAGLANAALRLRRIETIAQTLQTARPDCASPAAPFFRFLRMVRAHLAGPLSYSPLTSKT